MKFIVDAQMPFALALLMRSKGLDVIHTDDLLNKERTSDNEIRTIAREENRIVVTKDKDFFDSYLLNRSPAQLLLVSTGNIINKDLFQLFEQHIELMLTFFKTYSFLELTNDELFAHE